MDYLLLFLFGIGTGVLSGLLGIGGGVAIVPGLVLLFGFTQREAQGTSLAVLVPPIGLFAALAYYRHGYVRLPVTGWLALGFVIGAFLGALLVPRISEAVLRPCFGLVLLYVGFLFLFSPAGGTRGSALPAGLASLLTALAALLLRRRFGRRKQRYDPSDDIDYHI